MSIIFGILWLIFLAGFATGTYTNKELYILNTNYGCNCGLGRCSMAINNSTSCVLGMSYMQKLNNRLLYNYHFKFKRTILWHFLFGFIYSLYFLLCAATWPQYCQDRLDTLYTRNPSINIHIHSGLNPESSDTSKTT